MCGIDPVRLSSSPYHQATPKPCRYRTIMLGFIIQRNAGHTLWGQIPTFCYGEVGLYEHDVSGQMPYKHDRVRSKWPVGFGTDMETGCLGTLVGAGIVICAGRWCAERADRSFVPLLKLASIHIS
jgi:hypothetical protein